MNEKRQGVIERMGLKPGQAVRVRKGEDVFEGILLPSHEFSAPDTITLKLSSGYNIGVRIGEDTDIKILREHPPATGFRRKANAGGRGPKVAFIGTGGTIASFVDYRTGGVFPAYDAKDIVSLVPEIEDICILEGRNLLSIFSENMTVREWKSLAEEVERRLNEGYRGVVISHGTDTMGYTASALAFMLGRLNGPVVLVGAQRSPDRPSFDGYINLISAARVAASSDIGEVVVVMHADSSDRGCMVHRGTKVRKMHTSRRDAFRSINAAPVAFVDDEVHYLSEYRAVSKGRVTALTSMEESVALVNFYPGMRAEDFDAIARGKRGIVVAGTGLGHVSSEIVDEIRSLVAGGVHVVMTSQCLYGSVDMKVYATGRDLIRAGVIDGGDMLPETAFVKLMWVLGRGEGEVGSEMKRDIAGEITARRCGGNEF